MTDKKSNDSRRKLLKSIAAGSGAIVAGKSLPENWTKPVIDSVVLPAHANTSPEPPPPPPPAGLTGIFLTTETIMVSTVEGQFPLAVAVRSDIVNNVATVTGVVGSVPISESGIAVPGTTSVTSGANTATIGLLSVNGTAPNRQLTVRVELTGDVTFGPQNFTSPESLSCP
jgi:hypothetical protein